MDGIDMTEQPHPQRRKGADHFGYGHQVALGKNKEGESLWHSHGKYYHKPDTYWCGKWSDLTPEELLSECESTLADLQVYHPELFKASHGREHQRVDADEDIDGEID